MTDGQFQALKAKIERELPIRKKLAAILDVKLEDQTMAELVSLVAVCAPEHAPQVAPIVRDALRSNEASTKGER